jgi:hypothetical protein
MLMARGDATRREDLFIFIIRAGQTDYPFLSVCERVTCTEPLTMKTADASGMEPSREFLVPAGGTRRHHGELEDQMWTA